MRSAARKSGERRGSCRPRRRRRASRWGSGAPSRSSACRGGSAPRRGRSGRAPPRRRPRSVIVSESIRATVAPRRASSASSCSTVSVPAPRCLRAGNAHSGHCFGGRSSWPQRWQSATASARWNVSADVAVGAAHDEAAPRAGDARAEAAAVEEAGSPGLRPRAAARSRPSERAPEVAPLAATLAVGLHVHDAHGRHRAAARRARAARAGRSFPSSALRYDSSEGVALPSTTTAPASRARTRPTSRAW